MESCVKLLYTFFILYFQKFLFDTLTFLQEKTVSSGFLDMMHFQNSQLRELVDIQFSQLIRYIQTIQCPRLSTCFLSMEPTQPCLLLQLPSVLYPWPSTPKTVQYSQQSVPRMWVTFFPDRPHELLTMSFMCSFTVKYVDTGDIQASTCASHIL